MNRRIFLKTSLVTLGAIGAGASYWVLSPSGKRPITFDAMLEKLQSFTSQPPIFIGTWNTAQAFNHMAQSVEYSMLGFPEHKSDLFKSTVGRSAYKLFSQKGRMHHDLVEPIPGAPSLISTADDKMAVTRLINSLLNFRNFDGKLQPHFAFGELSYQEYELAHILHIENHLEQIAV